MIESPPATSKQLTMYLISSLPEKSKKNNNNYNILNKFCYLTNIIQTEGMTKPHQQHDN
jgi:hypothetical protein